MHRLLIVDDDEIMREGIVSNIDWEANGIEVVGTAHNGMESLEKIKTCLPEVILSDIRMPFVDGLQLTEAISKLYPHIKVVLLTAYDDFQYAKKALDLRVQQYVMKYEENDSILQAVVNAFAEYEKQQSNREIVRRSRELLRDQYLCHLLLGDRQAEEADNGRLIELHMEGGGFCVAVADVNDPRLPGGKESPLKMELTLEKVRDHCEAMATDGTFGVYSVILNHQIVFLFNPPTDSADELRRIEQYLTGVVENAERDLQKILTVGVGNIYGERRSIPVAYEEAVQAFELKNYLRDEEKSHPVIQINQMRNYGNSHLRLLEKVISYINANYCKEDLSLNQISEAVYVSPTYISMLFKKYKGINLNEYITNIRIKKAAELLCQTDLKTYEIAEKTGYPNSQYFSVIFKKCMGCSPTDYRRQRDTDTI